MNTTEAWSSKKIVDTLCPPFTETGNPITCNPVEDYPLDVTVTMEPIQAGSGDPSPENVRAISGYDSVKVNVRGKNLFLFSTINLSGTKSGVTCVYDAETQLFTLNGTFSSDSPQGVLHSGKNFIFPDLRAGDTICASGNIPDGAYFQINCIASGRTTKLVGTYGNNVGTIPDDFENISTCYIGVLPNSTFENSSFHVQIEVGSTPTAYEPYQPGTTATITMPETIYGGTVDAVTGVGSKDVDIIELAVADMNNNAEEYPGWLNQDWIGNYVENTNQDARFAAVADYVASNADGNKLLRFNGLRVVYFQEKNFGLTQSQLKEQYPDLVFQFAFRRLSPEPFQVTGNQPIPTLAGENTVYTDGNSVTVSGRQDLLYTLQNMQTQTTNLNRFIAEGGTQ